LLNQGLFEFRRQIDYKCARHGGRAVFINPAYTSQTCAACGHIAKENRLTQAVFVCVHCGHQANADVNAAQNILAKGLAA
jgi:putative transposase